MTHIRTRLEIRVLYKSAPFYDVICLLTAVGLTAGGSRIVHIYTKTIHSTVQYSTHLHKNNTQNNTNPQIPVLQQLENCMCLVTMEDGFIVMNVFGFMQVTFTGPVFNCKIYSL
jgi:hypothetical protein